jgi:hypothetical protein
MLSANETQLVGNSLGQPVNGIFEHTIDTKISSVKFKPILNLKINELNLMFGLDFAYLLKPTTYTQSEKILEPSDIRYENDQRTRMNYSGNLQPINNYLYGIEIGIGWDFIMDYTSSQNLITFTPEVFYHYGFKNLIKNEKWIVNSLNIGIAVKFNKYRSQTQELREVIDNRPEKLKSK